MFIAWLVLVTTANRGSHAQSHSLDHRPHDPRQRCLHGAGGGTLVGKRAGCRRDGSVQRPFCARRRRGLCRGRLWSGLVRRQAARADRSAGRAHVPVPACPVPRHRVRGRPGRRWADGNRGGDRARCGRGTRGAMATAEELRDGRCVMLKWFMKRKLRAFGESFGYETSYAQELVDGDAGAGFALARLSAAAAYRADAPKAAWYAAKIVAAMSEDCGPCVQLAVTMAEHAGVPGSDLRAIVSGDPARMSAEASLGFRFAKAALARSADLDDLREEVVKRWGRKALGAIALTMVASRTFPALKYALGHGRSYQSVEIGGATIAPGRFVHA